ncbi:GNAT family N-acetyltransferase [Paludifilum halophilum]|uniref:N-acetyltransferase domain-containing protein n=1 Tax=Paludifilum halophilum TaxID=1642702 RepID=A0A235B6R7_9BACL|nr:hypothetical protein [Paludifilum halophilum]OYD07998.1 hypothetical protein CHM34_07725 [Paludifilum halophilum]
MFTVRKATAEDIESITHLLRTAGTNDEGVDKHLDHFLIVEDPRVQPPRIVGTAGIEIYGNRGLLRSFVMKTDSWNAKVALELIGVILAHTGRSGLKEVYLMAGIAQHIFEHFGFRSVEWEDLPESIRRSDHIQKMEKEAAGRPMVYCNRQQDGA